MNPDDLSNAWHLDPTTSAVLVFALVPAFFVWRYRITRAESQWEAERAVQARVPPAGVAYALGRVVPLDGDAAPVVLVIHETGVERQGRKGRYVHWEESRRELTARPFDVREADGRVVRVEPGADPTLAAYPTVEGGERFERDGTRSRKRVARLAAGERVFVAGVASEVATLAGASSNYRDAPSLPAVRRPDDGPLAIERASYEEVHRERSRDAAMRSRILVGLAALLTVVSLPHYLARVAMGHPAQAVVTRTWTSISTTTNRGTTTHRTLYHAELQSGEFTLRQEVSATTFGDIARGDTVPVLRVDAWPGASQLGSSATLHGLSLVPIGLLVAIAWLLSPRHSPAGGAPRDP
jgi:hypothetical protein